MKEAKKPRIIIWAGILFITLTLGLVGLFLSGDVVSVGLFDSNSKNTNLEEANNTTSLELSDIVSHLKNYVNNSYTQEKGFSADVIFQSDVISVNIKNQEISYDLNFKVEGNIISFHSTNDIEKDDIGKELFLEMLTYIQDKYYNIPTQDVLSIVNSKEAKTFTLEKDGFDEKITDVGFIISFDYTKQISRIEITNHITVEDLKLEGQNNHFLKGDGSYKINKHSLFLYKQGSENEAIISIFEEEELTTNAYKTLISVLTEMFNVEEANNFALVYPGLEKENKAFVGYSIEVNPEYNDFESEILNSNIDVSKLKLLRITIDKSLIN